MLHVGLYLLSCHISYLSSSDSAANRALPYRVNIDKMTIEKCTDACFSKDYIYAGVEYGSVRATPVCSDKCSPFSSGMLYASPSYQKKRRLFLSNAIYRLDCSNSILTESGVGQLTADGCNMVGG